MAGGTALVKAGKLRAIAVSSARRWPSMPDVPTIVETVPDVDEAVDTPDNGDEPARQAAESEDN